MAVAVHIYILLSSQHSHTFCDSTKLQAPTFRAMMKLFELMFEFSQLDNSYETPWEVHFDAADWDTVAESSRLRHTQVDHDRGVRGFLQDILEATKCHGDLQETHDDGALQAYLVKYPVKFRDSAKEEWLNDAHGGDTLAQSILYSL